MYQVRTCSAYVMDNPTNPGVALPYTAELMLAMADANTTNAPR